MSPTLVNSIELVQKLIEEIECSHFETPIIFVDLEGTNLSRHGSIAIMQILVPPKPQVHLIDVEVLKGQAFDTETISGCTLRKILESNKYPKVFFDVRNDSDALYSLYRINIASVVDLQLLEFATRSIPGRFVKGLAKCISEDGGLGLQELRQWRETKDAGSKLFAPEKGGRYQVFHERSLLPALVQYCVQDVLLLPKLLVKYAGKLDACLASQVSSEALRRVTLSQSASFVGNGRHMAVGPSISHRATPTPAMVFPMSLIHSPRLSEHCSLSATVEEETTGPPTQAVGAMTTLALESSPDTRTVLISEPSSGVDMQTLRALNGQGGDEGSGSDDDEWSRSNDDEWSRRNDDYSPDSDNNSADYTACSAEDCGYCGKCMY